MALSSARARDAAQVDNAPEVAKKMLGQVLVTKQTGPQVSVMFDHMSLLGAVRRV